VLLWKSVGSAPGIDVRLGPAVARSSPALRRHGLRTRKRLAKQELAVRIGVPTARRVLTGETSKARNTDDPDCRRTRHERGPYERRRR
jgi:hypothetical protein